MTLGALRSLSHIDHADWIVRESLQAGTTLGHPVFWCLGAQAETAEVLVGADDETWDLAVTLPLSAVVDAASRASRNGA